MSSILTDRYQDHRRCPSTAVLADKPLCYDSATLLSRGVDFEAVHEPFCLQISRSISCIAACLYLLQVGHEGFLLERFLQL